MANSTIKPGPNNRDWALVSTIGGGGGGFPAQIIALSLPGTSGAYATVKQLDASGLMTSSQYHNIWIVPNPEFAEVGDRGIVNTYTPTSGTGGSNVRYMQISKATFLVY